MFVSDEKQSQRNIQVVNHDNQQVLYYYVSTTFRIKKGFILPNAYLWKKLSSQCLSD